MVSNGSQRVAGLDVMRTAAILPVVIGHGAPLMASTGGGFPWILLPDGVDIFFVLSGFLIGQIIFRLREITPPHILDFWIRRWARTLPNYYLFLVLNIIFSSLHWIPTSLEQFSWHYLFFAQNLTYSRSGFFWESWSLSIEEWFYLSIPLAIFLFTRMFRTPVRTAHLLSLMLFLIIPLALRLYKARAGLDLDFSAWDIHFRRAATLRLDAIGYGVGMAYLKTYHEDLFQKIRWPAALLAVAGQCILWAFHPPAGSLYMKVFSFAAHGIVYTSAIPLLDSIRTLPKFVAIPFEWISRISYSMYLVNHLLVLLIIHRTIPSEWSPAGAWTVFATYFGATLLLSHLCYTKFERPAMRIRDWLVPTGQKSTGH